MRGISWLAANPVSFSRSILLHGLSKQASTLHTTSEHGVSSITTADAHTPAASSRLNWRPCQFKWTRPFRRKTKSGFCACAITFQTRSNCSPIMNAMPLQNSGAVCCVIQSVSQSVSCVPSALVCHSLPLEQFNKLEVQYPLSTLYCIRGSCPRWATKDVYRVN